MGNRSYIVLKDKKEYGSAIYLHWNGGPESIYAFIDTLKEYGARMDISYGTARLVQLIGNFMGGTLSLGIEGAPQNKKDLEQYTPGDNGLFVYDVNTEKMERMMSDCTKSNDGQYHEKVKWLSDKQVEQERKEAYKHPYLVDKDGIVEDIKSKNDEHFIEKAATA